MLQYLNSVQKSEPNTISWKPVETVEESPHDYFLEETPWQYLEKLTLHKKWNLGKTFNKIHTERVEEEKTNFPTIRSAQDIFEEYFTCEGKLRLVRMKKNVEMWCIFAATEGLIRCNRNKDFFLYEGPKRTVMFFKNDRVNWTKINCGFEAKNAYLENVVETCNNLITIMIRRVSERINIKASYKKDILNNVLQNLRNLPEFVTWSKYRNTTHQYFRWQHRQCPQGGEQQPLQAAKSIPIKKQSTHNILCQYNDFLLPMIRTPKKN